MTVVGAECGFMVITLLLLLAIAKISIQNLDSRLQAATDNKQTIIILPAEQYKFASGRADLPVNLKNFNKFKE
ncbi:MAG: hypothetical protein C4322_09090 [Mastigocladus sp. ERB_26_1]